MEGNQYFEQQRQAFLRSVSDEELVKRSKECQYIHDQLATNQVWKTVLRDCKKWVTQLDAKWQDCYDEKQMEQMRVLKFAYNHIFQLPDTYKEELDYITEELRKRENPDFIEKDYDQETNMEKQ